MKDKEWIEEQICEIMCNDGPDGHSDGSDIITDFIEALLNGKEEEWVSNYRFKCEEEERKYQERLREYRNKKP